MNKKFIVLFIVLCFFITGCSEESSSTVNNQESTADTSVDLTSYLKKCTVMEASDLYSTGNTTGNVFDKAKETCQKWYDQFGEKDFIDSINEDWENRKDEQIEGKPLTEYLDILNW